MDSDLSRAIYASETAADDDRGAIRFRVVRDFGDTLSTTFGFLRENGRELGLAIAAIAGPVALLANVASGIVQARMYATLLDPATASSDPFAMFRVLGSPAYLLAIALGMVAPFLVLALTFAYVRGYRRGEAGTLTPSRLWAEAKGMVGPLLLFYLASIAALMLGAAVNLIPCLGTLAYLAAMVYVFPVSSIAFVVRAEEGLGIVASWKRADALVRPHWGQSFGVTFLSWMLLMIVMIALAMVTLVPGMMAGGLSGGMTQPPLALTVLSALAGAVIVLAYAIPFLASVFQYHTLVERAEGIGFGADIAALATPARAAEPDATFTARPAAPYAPPAPDAGFGAAVRDSAAGAAAAPSASAAEFGESSIAAPDPGFRDANAPGASSTDTPPAVPPAATPPSTPSETPPPDAPPSAPGGFRGGGFGDRTLRDL